MSSSFVTESRRDVAATAASLLRAFGPEAPFFFASPWRSLLAEGPHARLATDGVRSFEDLADRAMAFLGDVRRAGHPAPTLVGAVPFEAFAASHLLVPTSVRRAGPLPVGAPAPHPRPLLTSYRPRLVPEPAEYVRRVGDVLARIEAGHVHKVVLSRALELETHHHVDVGRLLSQLAAQNPSTYVFGVRLPGGPGAGAPLEPCAARTLVGASPELLVSRSGSEVWANPLAGSAPRSDDPAEDRRRAHALLVSEKDRREHALVVDAVAESLGRLCSRLHVPSEPSLVQTPVMWHLSTRIEGELRDRALTSLHLAAALHPTPAVCGHPRDAAKAVLDAVEGVGRGFFTGVVGHCDANGDGEWALAIRCAEIQEERVRLFAGAGIVAGSRADAELAETSTKMRTMWNALGLPTAAGPTASEELTP